MFDGVSSSGFCISRSTTEMLCSSQSGSTKGPSWGYHRLVLGAIGSFLSTFGENRPRFLKNLSKLTFEYPHEGPCVVTTRGRPLRISHRFPIRPPTRWATIQSLRIPCIFGTPDPPLRCCTPAWMLAFGVWGLKFEFWVLGFGCGFSVLEFGPLGLGLRGSGSQFKSNHFA